jgi:hypothetical protein
MKSVIIPYFRWIPAENVSRLTVPTDFNDHGGIVAK